MTKKTKKTDKDKPKDENAVALGRKGGQKGGIARAKNLTSEEKREIGRRGAEARWSIAAKIDIDSLPRAVAEGPLDLVGRIIPCAVLDDGRRVISRRGVGIVLDRKHGGSDFRKGGGELPFFLSPEHLKPFISDELRLVVTNPVMYQGDGGLNYGMEHIALPQILDVWIKANHAGALKTPVQKKIAENAYSVMRALAGVALAALIDEATGYQDVRARDALARLLKKYVAAELQPWMPTFKPTFYKEMFRLRRWPYDPKSLKRPGVAGYLTNDIVYRRLAPGVLVKLKEMTKKHKEEKQLLHTPKLHRGLTKDHGHPALEHHLIEVTALMRGARHWDEFVQMIDRSMPKYGETLKLPFDEAIAAEILADDKERQTP